MSTREERAQEAARELARRCDVTRTDGTPDAIGIDIISAALLAFAAGEVAEERARAREVVAGIRGPAWEELIHGVDATPDADYPERIMEAHLHNNTLGRWSGDPSSQPICDAMNQASDERASLLRLAIAVIRARTVEPAPKEEL